MRLPDPSLDALIHIPAFLVPWGVLAAAMAAFAAWAGTGLARRLLLGSGVLDRPNARSSHVVPTPRGGGLAVVAVVLILLAAMTGAAALGLAPPVTPAIWLAAALVLAIVSFRDDVRPLPAGLRFGVQILAALAALPPLLAIGPVTQGWLPVWLDATVAVLAWVGFINFFNFMDGIDGIAGVETAAIGLGIAGVGVATGLWAWFGPGLVLAGAAAGFLLWNWHPARIFLGDVGSVPLGFLLGGLLLMLAAAGFWASALILPAYYLADAGLTLLRRLARGERIWHAHRGHFYQRAARARGDHAVVSKAVALANLGLVLAAWAALLMPVAALCAAALIVAGVLLWMTRA